MVLDQVILIGKLHFIVSNSDKRNEYVWALNIGVPFQLSNKDALNIDRATLPRSAII